MSSIGRRLNLRSYEPWFAIGGLVVLRPKRGVAAPAGDKQPGPPANATWLTATLTFGSPFDPVPQSVVGRVQAREVAR
jgi:hypothetical protein